MSNRRQPISGLNIYQDKQRRTIYYDIFTKKGYILKPSSYNQYNFYSKRLFFPIIIFVLCYSIKFGEIKFGLSGSLIAAALVLVLVEAFFRFKFLKSCAVSDHFVPYKKATLITQLQQGSKPSDLIVRCILYSAFGILLVIYGFMAEFSNIELIGSIVVSVLLIGYGLLHLLAIKK